MPSLSCPNCGSKLRKSRTRGFTEKLRKALGTRAFRCANKTCNWRGLIKTKTFIEALLDISKNKPKTTFSLLFVVSAPMLYYILKTIGCCN